jgi:hypothetical protein
MGKKSRRKTGRKSLDQNAIIAQQTVHGSITDPAASEREIITAHLKPGDLGRQVQYRPQDQLAPPAAWLPAASRDKVIAEHPDAMFVRIPGEDRDRPLDRGAIEATSSAHQLPDWFRPHDPDPPAVMSLRPGEVLDAHARLAETLARPPTRLIEFFDAFVQDTMAKAGSRGGEWEKVNVWAGMFWPAQSAPEWCGVLTRQLKAARPYQVTAPMVDLVSEIYQRTMDEPTLITRDDIPWPAGFAWLDKANTFTDRHGNAIYNRAYSWDVVYLPARDGSKAPGIRVISWSHPDDRDSYWTEAARTIMDQSGGLGMGNTTVFPLNQEIQVEKVSGQPLQDSVPRWLRCLWAVLESTVSATSQAGHGEISHHVRHRAARSLDHTEVTVVVLRRPVTLPAEGDGNGYRRVNWTCRWFVDGFWRHGRRDADWEAQNEELDEKTGRPRRHHAIPDAAREHCVTCGMPVSWVASYDKGPPGLPFKQRRILHRLQR